MKWKKEKHPNLKKVKSDKNKTEKIEKMETKYLILSDSRIIKPDHTSTIYSFLWVPTPVL